MIKCAQAALNYLSEQLSEQKLSNLRDHSVGVIETPAIEGVSSNVSEKETLPEKLGSSFQNIPMEKRLSSFLWFLSNREICGVQNFTGAMKEFIGFLAALDSSQFETNTEVRYPFLDGYFYLYSATHSSRIVMELRYYRADPCTEGLSPRPTASTTADSL